MARIINPSETFREAATKYSRSGREQRMSPSEIGAWITLAGQVAQSPITEMIARGVSKIGLPEPTPEEQAKQKLKKEEEAAVAKAGTGKPTFGGPADIERGPEGLKVKRMTIGEDRRASAQSKMTSGESVRWAPQEVIVALQSAINTTGNPLSGKKVSQSVAQRIAMMQNREGRPFTHRELIDYAADYVEPERITARQTTEDEAAAAAQAAEATRQAGAATAAEEELAAGQYERGKPTDPEDPNTIKRRELQRKLEAQEIGKAEFDHEMIKLERARAGLPATLSAEEEAAETQRRYEEAEKAKVVAAEDTIGKRQAARPLMTRPEDYEVDVEMGGSFETPPSVTPPPAQPGTYEPGVEEVSETDKVSFTETETEKQQREPSYEPETPDAISGGQADFEEVIKRYNVQVSEPAKKNLLKLYTDEARAAGEAAPSPKQMAHVVALASQAVTLEQQTAVLELAARSLPEARGTSFMEILFGPSQAKQEARKANWLKHIKSFFPTAGRGRGRSVEQEKLTRARRLHVEAKTRKLDEPTKASATKTAKALDRTLRKRSLTNREYRDARKNVVKAYDKDIAAATRRETAAAKSRSHYSRIAHTKPGKKPGAKPAKPTTTAPAGTAAHKEYLEKMKSWRIDVRAHNRNVKDYAARVRKINNAIASAKAANSQVAAYKKRITALRKERAQKVKELDKRHKAAAKRQR